MRSLGSSETTHDTGRSEVYAAELMAFDGTELEVVEPFDVVAAVARYVVADPWWRGGRVEVRPARRDARSSTTRTAPGAVAVIRLAGPQCTRATVVHELAHVLAGAGAGHGPRFRRAHVDVAAVAVGTERAAWLADAFGAAGLVLGARAWPEPPGGPDHAIAR